MRAWFNQRNRREQVLLTTFILLAAAIWATAAAGRFRARLEAWRSARLEQQAQQLWIDRRDEITRRSVAAVSNLDPSRTYDATGLVSAVTTLAKNAGLAPAVDSAATQRTPDVAYHTARVTFRRAGLPAVLKFYDELARQSPYLDLNRAAIQTDRAAPGALNVTLEISATQILRP